MECKNGIYTDFIRSLSDIVNGYITDSASNIYTEARDFGIRKYGKSLLSKFGLDVRKVMHDYFNIDISYLLLELTPDDGDNSKAYYNIEDRGIIAYIDRIFDLTHEEIDKYIHEHHAMCKSSLKNDAYGGVLFILEFLLRLMHEFQHAFQDLLRSNYGDSDNERINDIVRVFSDCYDLCTADDNVNPSAPGAVVHMTIYNNYINKYYYEDPTERWATIISVIIMWDLLESLELPSMVKTILNQSLTNYLISYSTYKYKVPGISAAECYIRKGSQLSKKPCESLEGAKKLSEKNPAVDLALGFNEEDLNPTFNAKLVFAFRDSFRNMISTIMEDVHSRATSQPPVRK